MVDNNCKKKKKKMQDLVNYMITLNGLFYKKEKKKKEKVNFNLFSKFGIQPPFFHLDQLVRKC